MAGMEIVNLSVPILKLSICAPRKEYESRMQITKESQAKDSAEKW